MAELAPQHRAHPTEQGEWMFVARVIRYAVAVVMGEPQGECLPGEREACGQGAAEHAIAFSAMLGAHGLHLAEHAGAHHITTFWDELDRHRVQLDHQHDGGTPPDAA